MKMQGAGPYAADESGLAAGPAFMFAAHRLRFPLGVPFRRDMTCRRAPAPSSNSDWSSARRYSIADEADASDCISSGGSEICGRSRPSIRTVRTNISGTVIPAPLRSDYHSSSPA